jgi:hypothetical protein
LNFDEEQDDMATLEGTRASAEFMCVSLVPDVCKSPTIPVPYKILSLFDCAVNFSTNVRFRQKYVFRHNSRLSTVRCDEPGVGGGILSGVNMGFCRPIDGTASTTVRVNGSFVDYHVGTYMFMNCAGPEGPFNTIGQVIFLGNMLPGPVSASGKVPKSCIAGSSGLLADLNNKFGDLEGLVQKAKTLYSLANTNWSNPGAVLGAIGGLAGIAGLQDMAGVVGQAKGLYDVGNKIANTDWSDPGQALSAIAGAAGVAGMQDSAQVANLANTIRNTINTDWDDPGAALASATNIMKATGLNKMVAEMASNAILDRNSPGSQQGTVPPFFPRPGVGSSAAIPQGSATCVGSGPPACSNTSIPPSADGLPRQHVTQDVLDHLKESNPGAHDRYMALSDVDKCNAFIETQTPTKDSNGNDYSTNDLTAIYIPGEGFSTSQAERDGLPNVSGHLPSELKNVFSEVFVAGKDSRFSVGSFFGIKEKEGNVYLLGGLIDLGSPEMPGAGNTWAWWVPDRLLNMDMSPYYDYHDKEYYGSNVGLSDLGTILSHELEAFRAGATLNPLQLPLQAIYSAATTAVGLGTAAGNSLMNFGSGTFSSLGDFFGSVFGSSSSVASGPAAQSFAPGGCFPQLQASLPGQGAPGAPGTAPTSGAPTNPTTAGASATATSGAGTNGVLITTKAGSPAAAAAAIEASFRRENATTVENAESTSNSSTSTQSSQQQTPSQKSRDPDHQTKAENEGEDSATASNPKEPEQPKTSTGEDWRGKLNSQLHDEDAQICHKDPTAKVLADGILNNDEHIGRNEFNWCPETKPNGEANGIDWSEKSGLANLYHQPLECATGVPNDGSLGPGSFECCYDPATGKLIPNAPQSGTYNFADGIGFTIPNPGIVGPDRIPIGQHGELDVAPHDQNPNYNHVNMSYQPTSPSAASPSTHFPKELVDNSNVPGEITYSKPHLNNTDPNGPGAIRH